MVRRPSHQTIAVLEKLLAEPLTWQHGYDFVRDLGIASGTLYPILMRLHDRDVLETRWEDSPLNGRPRRHLYRLTEAGSAWARDVTAPEPSTRPVPQLGAT